MPEPTLREPASEGADGPNPLGRENDIVFFTCADRRYESFAPLYAASVLHHLPAARVEIGLEDVEQFREREAGARVVEDAFPGRILFRNVGWSFNGREVPPNSIRFLNEPRLRATWTYVGDIDIIFLDRLFFDRHLAFMERAGLPYSNSVRPGTRRLSGLHLVRSEVWYPLPDLTGVDASGDEALLYELCRRHGLPVQDQEWFRPQHGIHISPNRSVEGWGIKGWLPRFQTFAGTGLYRRLAPTLAPDVQRCLELVENESLLGARRRVRASRPDPLEFAEYKAKRDDYIAQRRLMDAAKLGLQFLADHPESALVHHQLAWTLLALRMYPEAVQHAERAVALNPERDAYATMLDKARDALARGGPT